MRLGSLLPFDMPCMVEEAGVAPYRDARPASGLRGSCGSVFLPEGPVALEQDALGVCDSGLVQCGCGGTRIQTAL